MRPHSSTSLSVPSLATGWIVVTAIALALTSGVGNPGCSAVGYTAGSILDASHRQEVPLDRLPLLAARQQVWLKLANGESVTGHLLTSKDPDSLSIALPSRDGSDPFSRPQERTLARSSIRRVEVPGSEYRWLGLTSGMVADMTIVILMATSDHSFHTYNLLGDNASR